MAVQPDHVASTVLGDVDLVVALGEAAKETIQMFGAAVGIGVPPVSVTNLEKGEALGWWRSGTRAFRFKSIPTKGTRRRHIRKYSQGELKPDESFYFEGPEKKLHLRAQNLQTFLQLADGVDDETWLHHLQSHDYSRWFRNQLKDEDLATAAEDVEHDKDMSPAESRARMRSAIEDRYTAPA